jgi:hypothetical protein
MTKTQREELLDELQTARAAAHLARERATEAVKLATDAREYAEASLHAAQRAISMLETAGEAFKEVEGGVVTRKHLRDDSYNFIETRYDFKLGFLVNVDIEAAGCAICCETEDESLCSDHNLFIEDEGIRDDLIEEYLKK